MVHTAFPGRLAPAPALCPLCSVPYYKEKAAAAQGAPRAARHKGQQPRTAAPNASVSPCVSPSTKFYAKPRTRHFVPRTQFGVKFPWRCRRRRRMSADGDGFYTLRQSEPPQRYFTRFLQTLPVFYTNPPDFAEVLRRLYAAMVDSRGPVALQYTCARRTGPRGGEVW